MSQSLLCALGFTGHKTPRGGAILAHIETMAKDNSLGLVSSLLREGQEVPPSSHLHLPHVPMSKHSMLREWNLPCPAFLSYQWDRYRSSTL